MHGETRRCNVQADDATKSYDSELPERRLRLQSKGASENTRIRKFLRKTGQAVENSRAGRQLRSRKVTRSRIFVFGDEELITSKPRQRLAKEMQSKALALPSLQSRMSQRQSRVARSQQWPPREVRWFQWVIRQIVPLASSDTRSAPSCATATPTGLPHTSESPATNPVRKSWYSPVGDPSFRRIRITL